MSSQIAGLAGPKKASSIRPDGSTRMVTGCELIPHWRTWDQSLSDSTGNSQPYSLVNLRPASSPSTTCTPRNARPVLLSAHCAKAPPSLLQTGQCSANTLTTSGEPRKSSVEIGFPFNVSPERVAASGRLASAETAVASLPEAGGGPVDVDDPGAGGSPAGGPVSAPPQAQTARSAPTATQKPKRIQPLPTTAPRLPHRSLRQPATGRQTTRGTLPPAVIRWVLVWSTRRRGAG